jgi:hypothetical protein
MRKIPEGTPDDVLAVAKKYWHGTTEYDRFRIHVWNDLVIHASTPGVKDSSMVRGGHGAFPVVHLLLPRDGKGVSQLRGSLRKWEGRVKRSDVQAAMAGLSGARSP